MKLYELTGKFKELSIIDDIEPEVLKDTLESIECEFQEKGRNVAAYFLNLDASASALKEAESRIASRRKVIEKQSESLKEYLRFNMGQAEITKIECPEFSITLGKPSKIVNIEDIDKLAEEFVNSKVVVTADKASIKKAIKNGDTVIGASLIDGKSRLTIK